MGGGMDIRLGNSGLVALVDAADYAWAMQYRWQPLRYGQTWRVRRYDPAVWKALKKIRYSISMHRELLQAPSAMVVDHINGDGLDNRRTNLRLCLVADNNKNRRHRQSTNTSGVHGVFWERDIAKWRVQITINNKAKHIGVFTNIDEAKIARKRAEALYYGDFAGNVQ